MKLIRHIPRSLRLVSACVLTGVLVLVLWAVATAGPRTGYDLVKDVIVPLLGPIVAILIPTLLFYVLPLTQNQQKASVDLFNAFHSEPMRESRHLVWRYFVTEARASSEEERTRRLDEFLKSWTEDESGRRVPPDMDALYQKTSRLLDFFVMVNDGLERDMLDRGMIRSFLAYYYVWYRDEVMTPLRSRAKTPSRDPKYMPLWRRELSALDALCAPQA